MTDQESTGSDSAVHIHGPIPRSDAHAPQVVIAEIIKAPRLRGVTTPDFVEFKDKRDIYERRLAGIDPNPQALSHLQSYRDSIPRHLLSFMVQSGMVEATKLEEVTEEDLRNCIARNAIFDIEKHGLDAFEEKILFLSMKEVFLGGTLTLSVTDLCVRYLSILEEWGCDNLIEVTPDAAIDHILNRITPCSLSTRMARIIKSRVGDGMEKSFRRFLKELLAETHRMSSRLPTTPSPDC